MPGMLNQRLGFLLREEASCAAGKGLQLMQRTYLLTSFSTTGCGFFSFN